MRERPRVLVLTLYSGEQELEQGRASLRAQSLGSWEQRVFEFLPNKRAHQALQREVMASLSDFDLFLKLDADMVLRDARALERLVAFFRADPRLDHLSTAVHDWFSDSLIMGLHLWSSRVRFETSDERLFVDEHPVYPGLRQILMSEPAPFASHCPDPSPHQAFFFGLHRALKALQRERTVSRFSIGLSRGQWQILQRTWDHFLRSGDRRLGLAIWGADQVLRGRVSEAGVEQKRDAYAVLLAESEALDAAALRAQLGPRWGPTGGAARDYWSRVAPRAAAALPLEVWRKLRTGSTS